MDVRSDATPEARLQLPVIGIIGSDAESVSLATRLATPGRRVMVYPAPAAGSQKPPAHVEVAATPTDIAFECECVLSTIEDTARLRDILLGTEQRLGLGLELSPGATIIDLGIRPPRECQSIMGVLGMRGISLIDAAIVGTPDSVAAGAATILVGGFPDAVDAVMPILTAIGRVERTGPLGSAHTAAALMGYMEAAHMIALDEAARVGEALGLNGAALARLIELDTDLSNIVAFSRRADLAGALVAERGLSAEVIDLTLRKLHQPAPKSR